ncbi:MAG TPA: FecR domain-containing protein [Polyangia bacterium]
MIEGKEKYARVAARVLRESMAEQAAEQSESSPARTDDRRDAIVAAMALAIAAKARRRRAYAATAIVLAAAAGVLVVLRLAGGAGLSGSKAGAASALVVEHQDGRGNLLVRTAGSQPLPDLGVLAVGDTVRTDESSTTTLGFDNGTRISLSSSARLRVDEIGATRRFSLLGGRFQAHVAKLTQGERFVVSTPDSEVEVRGTVFTVVVSSADAKCRDMANSSSVQVSEGAVWVRARDTQVLLHAGESWATPCPVSPSVGAPPAVVQVPVVQAPRLNPAPATAVHGAVRKTVAARAEVLPPRVSPPSLAPARPDSTSSPAPVSHLSEQNDLFSAAMAAERRGEHETAISTLNQLIERFPGSPLGESARAERQRIQAVRPPR